MLIRITFIILFFIFEIILNQEIPSNLFKSKIKKIEFDIGRNWVSNSTLSPFRYSNSSENDMKLYSNYQFSHYKSKILSKMNSALG